jgi:3-hydroxyacyl-[acyl-carrier-protein] dehydratase
VILSREFTVPFDHPVLRGHFPGNPIVPGVMLMAWCEQLAMELADVPILIKEWPQVKFLHPLKPDQTCVVTLKRQSANQASFSIKAGALMISSGRIEWIAAHG